MGLRLHGVWDNWGIVFDPIPFLCTDGTRKVRCWASLDALAKISGTAAIHGLSDPELADLFSSWAETFAGIASDKFDRHDLQPDGSVLIRAADVTAPIPLNIAHTPPPRAAGMRPAG